MTKSVFISALCLLALMFGSCGSKKVAIAQTQSAAPFGEVYSMPCGEFHDTKDKFAAVGIYRGSSRQKGELQVNAIENAKDIIRSKFHHSYQGMISNYGSTIGNNRGNDIETKIQRAGDQVLDMMLNDAYQVCTKFGAVESDGMMECYVAIEIPKGELASSTAKKVADALTEDEKMRINFNEQNYRKEMEERLENYKESHQ